jgi:hypothetical protein
MVTKSTIRSLLVFANAVAFLIVLVLWARRESSIKLFERALTLGCQVDRYFQLYPMSELSLLSAGRSISESQATLISPGQPYDTCKGGTISGIPATVVYVTNDYHRFLIDQIDRIVIAVGKYPSIGLKIVICSDGSSDYTTTLANMVARDLGVTVVLDFGSSFVTHVRQGFALVAVLDGKNIVLYQSQSMSPCDLETYLNTKTAAESG